MEKGLRQNLILRRLLLDILPIVVSCGILLTGAVTIGLAAARAWAAVDASRTISELERKVVRTTLNRDRLTRTLERLEKKTAEREIAREKLRDPF